MNNKKKIKCYNIIPELISIKHLWECFVEYNCY